jgi:hypothetical protein
MEGLTMNYAAELDDNNMVLRVIVGTAQWATDNLGGTWVDTEHKAGAGWTYDGTNIIPPPSSEPDDTIVEPFT